MNKIISRFKAKRKSERLLIFIMAATVLFFFIQSALPQEVSAAESNGISGFLESIIPSNTQIGKFFHDNIRKIGHFTEYGVFGVETALYILLFAKISKESLLSAAFGAFLVAFADETVQIFSGRGPSIYDVWLDFFGFFVFALAVLLFASVLSKLKKGK